MIYEIEIESSAAAAAFYGEPITAHVVGLSGYRFESHGAKTVRQMARHLRAMGFRRDVVRRALRRHREGRALPRWLYR